MVSDVKNRYIPADLKILTSQIIQLVSGSLASLIQARGTGFFLGYIQAPVLAIFTGQQPLIRDDPCHFQSFDFFIYEIHHMIMVGHDC